MRASLARMRLPSLAATVAMVEMPGSRVLVPGVRLASTAMSRLALAVLAALAALAAMAETAALVEQAAVELQAAVAPAVLAWLPRAALAVSEASEVGGLMQAL